MTLAPTLFTDRLNLRPHRLEDFDAYAAYWATPEARFMGGPLSRSHAWGAFCSDVAHWDLHGFGAWAIDVGSETVGQTAFRLLTSFPERELGWLIYPDHRGHGYATEAAAVARDYAFAELGWDSFVSYVDPENKASINVAIRIAAKLDETAERPDPEDLVFRHRRDTDVKPTLYRHAKSTAMRPQ